MDIQQIMIAVQARSTSKRYPRKSLAKIEDKTITEHVLQACRGCVTFLNKEYHKTNIKAFCVLLIPYGDELKDNIKNQLILEGDELDVLSRYQKATNEYMPDYVVRITGDCPLMIPPLLSRCIKAAVRDDLDYCSNVWEGMRTFEDGLDVEVMKNKIVHWLDRNATTPEDREHVTYFFRKHPPAWAKIGTVINHIDREHTKLSVDTPDDLIRCRENRRKIQNKLSYAKNLNHSIYRF